MPATVCSYGEPLACHDGSMDRQIQAGPRAGGQLSEFVEAMPARPETVRKDSIATPPVYSGRSGSHQLKLINTARYKAFSQKKGLREQAFLQQQKAA